MRYSRVRFQQRVSTAAPSVKLAALKRSRSVPSRNFVTYLNIRSVFIVSFTALHTEGRCSLQLHYSTNSHRPTQDDIFHPTDLPSVRLGADLGNVFSIIDTIRTHRKVKRSRWRNQQLTKSHSFRISCKSASLSGNCNLFLIISHVLLLQKYTSPLVEKI